MYQCCMYVMYVPMVQSMNHSLFWQCEGLAAAKWCFLWKSAVLYQVSPYFSVSEGRRGRRGGGEWNCAAVSTVTVVTLWSWGKYVTL